MPEGRPKGVPPAGSFVRLLSRALPTDVLMEVRTRVTARLRWLTSMRWLALAAQLLVVAPGLALGWLPSRLLPPYLAVVAALGVGNLMARKLTARRVGEGAVLLVLVVDLLGLTALLCLSGGAWNPLAPLVLIHACIGALLLSGWRSAAVTAAVSLSVVFITLIPTPPVGVDATDRAVVLLSLVLVGVVLWGLVTWLSATLELHLRLLSDAKDRQRRVDRLRALGVLATGFSHKLASPLNTLQLRIDRLDRSHPDNADVAAANGALAECSELLRSMASAALDTQLYGADAPLASLVERICRNWSLEVTDVRLDVRCDESDVRVPPLPFTQSLLNLLDNAAIAAQEAEEPTVEVRVEVRSDRVAVSVQDRGRGWPPEIRASLGQPFVTTRPDGVGLGLYNVKALSLALGGELVFDDRQGGGACATLLLPTQPQENTD